MSNSHPHSGARMFRALKRRIRYTLALPPYFCTLCISYLCDFRRYYRAASKGYQAVNVGKARYTELKSWIAADTHKIEKALALKSPRPGFGIAVIRRLIENLEAFHATFEDERAIQIAVNTLGAYCAFNDTLEQENKDLYERINALAKQAGETASAVGQGGAIKVARDVILAQSSIPNLDRFFESRHSIRNFTEQPVPMSSVEAAVRMALRTPSVCNRQSWKVYAYLDEKERSNVLACQKGNQGFGDLAGGVLVVTTDLATFFSYAERHQAWVDGGMFAMSLVYGLHASGIGSCCLNWCVDQKTDKELRLLTQIPDNEVVIMMIAIGHLPEELKVAESARKPLDEVLIVKPLDKA